MTHLLLLAALLGPTEATATDSTRDSRAEITAAGFGTSIALSGEYAFVGEPRGPSGVVHVYRRGTAGWRSASKLTAANGSPNDGFGASVAADGPTLLVGRIGAPNGADSARGTVHVFRRAANGTYASAGEWTAAGAPARAGFGAALLLSGDLALVGAPRMENGAVFVYRRAADGTWSQSGRLPVDSLGEGDLFGASLAMDGNRLVVGAPGRSAAKGALFVFTRSGDQFVQQSMLMSPSSTDGAQLGASVAINGTRIVAGSPGAFPAAGRRGATLGSVTSFEYSDISEIWRERKSFVPYEAGAARFGVSLAMAGDEIWVGAPISAFSAGRIYRIAPNADNGAGSMRVLNVGDLDAGAAFGASMAVAGNTAAVGMPNDGGGGGTVMFLSRNAAGTWTKTSTVYPELDRKVYSAVKGKEVMCAEDGKAGEFECGNASLLSFLPI